MRRIAVEKEKEFLEQLVQKGEVSHEDAQRLHALLKKIELVLTNRFHLFSMLFSALLERGKHMVFPHKYAASLTQLGNIYEKPLKDTLNTPKSF